MTDVAERDGGKQQNQIKLELAYHMPNHSLLCSVPLRHHSVKHTVLTLQLWHSLPHAIACAVCH